MHLPHAVLVKVFQQLDSRQVLLCSSVSRSWLEASRADAVWAGLCAVEYGGTLPPPRGQPAADGSTPAYSNLQAVLQEPSHSVDAVLAAHAQHMARYASLMQRVTGWEARVRSGGARRTISALHTLQTAQGLSVYFAVLEHLFLEEHRQLAVSIVACHEGGGQTIVLPAVEMDSALSDAVNTQLLEQTHVTGLSTWVERGGWQGLPPRPHLVLGANLHFQQLLTAPWPFQLPQVLPLRRPLAAAAGQPPADAPAFTAVLDFARHPSGEPLGSLAVPLGARPPARSDQSELEGPLASVRLLGRTSRLSDRTDGAWDAPGAEQPAEAQPSDPVARRIVAWMGQNATADLALYGARGRLRMGRACLDIWEAGGAAEGGAAKEWRLHFLPDREAAAGRSVFGNLLCLQQRGEAARFALRLQPQELAALTGQPGT